MYDEKQANVLFANHKSGRTYHPFIRMSSLPIAFFTQKYQTEPPRMRERERAKGKPSDHRPRSRKLLSTVPSGMLNGPPKEPFPPRSLELIWSDHYQLLLLLLLLLRVPRERNSFAASPSFLSPPLTRSVGPRDRGTRDTHLLGTLEQQVGTTGNQLHRT